MKRILITGAGSYVGTSFEHYATNKYPEKYLIDTLDMKDDNWKNYDFSLYDVVFHVAGIAHVDDGKCNSEQNSLYYKINTELAIETAKKAKSNGVKQFIFMSSSVVYGDSSKIGKNKTITSSTEVSPANCYANSKVKAEKGILQLESSTFRVVIIRSPMIYGKNCRGNYCALSKFGRKLPIFPDIVNTRSMLYIENLTEFVCLIINNEEKGIFHPQNSTYSCTSEIVRLIAKAHNRKIFLLKGFTWFIKFLECFIGAVSKAFGSLSYDMDISEYKEDYRVVKSLYETILKTEGKV